MTKRIVLVYRHRMTGHHFLWPMVTFSGFGLQVGGFPKRDLSPDSGSLLLGEHILELLCCSHPTGVHIRDQQAYRRIQSKGDSRRALALFERLVPRPTTRRIAERFSEVSVETTDQLRSWAIREWRFDYDDQAAVPFGKLRRVSKSLGVLALGAEVAEALRTR